MKKTILNALFLIASSLCAACGGDDGGPDAEPPTPDTPQPPTENTDPQTPTSTNDMLVMAHYMPWFVSPQASGVWNHWTMSTNALQADLGNLASHYQPLTGAYASDDETVLDYQCLLMKYSGLAGVIINYMGESGKNDHATISTNTQKMVDAATKAGLTFAICYDEQTALAEYVFPSETEAVAQGRTDMQYIKSHYFSKTNYLKNGDRPVLLIFGPARVKSSASWQTIAQPLGTADVVVLGGHSANYGSPAGEFLWVNARPDYTTHSYYFGGAMPGFWDVYKQFGQGNGYTTYDREGGQLFQRQLEAAKAAGLKHLQVSTWNDYGEGTTIEPTKEYGYLPLTQLQQFTGVSYTQSHLELIYRWYQVAKSRGRSNAQVTRAYQLLNALQPAEAEDIIKTLE